MPHGASMPELEPDRSGGWPAPPDRLDARRIRAPEKRGWEAARW